MKNQPSTLIVLLAVMGGIIAGCADKKQLVELDGLAWQQLAGQLRDLDQRLHDAKTVDNLMDWEADNNAPCIAVEDANGDWIPLNVKCVG